jgi:hypothetical protein
MQCIIMINPDDDQQMTLSFLVCHSARRYRNLNVNAADASEADATEHVLHLHAIIHAIN